ncbi:MAG TPA: DUF222 domain-containing protein [Acidimicrobiales bacterium]|nr:DUF222 domain-containing protein [Acidimicrobiales bacterium]
MTAENADLAIRTLTDETLEEELCSQAAHLDAAECRLVLMVAELDRRRTWGSQGLRSCAHWLNWRCGISLGTAREQVRVGRALDGLPVVRAAFGSGELSYSKVRAITRVADQRTEAALVDMARYATASQLERIVREYRRASPDEGPVALGRHQSRYVRTYTDDQGMLVVSARLSPEDGAAFLAALEAARQDVPAETSDEGVPAETSGPEAEAADALATVCETFLTGGTGPAGGPRASISVHVDGQVLVDPGEEGCAYVDGVGVVSSHTAHRLACDGAVSVLRFDPDGSVTPEGKTRSIPVSLRRAVMTRDRGCRWPGCTGRRRVDIHHVVFWSKGGRTVLSNLVALCRHHHRLVHEGGFRLILEPSGKVSVRTPQGEEVPVVPHRQPVVGPCLRQRQEVAGVVTGPDPGLVCGERFSMATVIDALQSAASES